MPKSHRPFAGNTRPSGRRLTSRDSLRGRLAANAEQGLPVRSELDLFDRVFMGQRRRHGLARDEVPDPSGPVARGGGNPPLVGTQLDVLYLIVMLPDLDRPGRLSQSGREPEAMPLRTRRIAFEAQCLNKPR